MDFNCLIFIMCKYFNVILLAFLDKHKIIHKNKSLLCVEETIVFLIIIYKITPYEMHVSNYYLKHVVWLGSIVK